MSRAMAVLWSVLLGMILGLAPGLAGCTGKAEVQCSEEKACPFGSICLNGACQEQVCATSDQCGIEQYCSTDHRCVTGCQADSDCMFGDGCDGGTCKKKNCADSRTDCSFGEFCSVAGECYDAAGYYCLPCEDDSYCGDGNSCYGGYCAVACESDRDCPNGYDCLPFTDFNGNVISYNCYTYCWLNEE